MTSSSGSRSTSPSQSSTAVAKHLRLLSVSLLCAMVVWPHAAHPPKPRHKRSLVYKCPAEPKWWERGCATIVKA